MSSLYLFTENFPYGKGEAFVEEELKVMAQKFGHVYIFPLHKVEGLRALPPNVSVVDLFEKDTYNGIKTLRSNAALYFSVLLKELLGVKYKAAFIKNIREHSSILLKAIAKSEILDKAINRSTENVYYSFWLYEWATILSILTKRKKIARFFARAHSFDIYGEYFRKDKIIPFRNLQLKYVTKIFPDSMQGVIALREQTRIYKDKVQIGYMGGIDYGMNAYVNDDVVKIVSCSFVVPRKRVWLIIEALKQAKVKVKWLHIGDGPDLEKIKATAAQLPANITCEFTGYIESADVLSYYKKYSFDLMLHVSEKEGLPNAVIDAASFGVPLIATDAGGTRELVNDTTGLLLPLDVTAAEITALINNFKSSRFNSMEFRQQVKGFWNAHFNGVDNYNKLAAELMSKE